MRDKETTLRQDRLIEQFSYQGMGVLTGLRGEVWVGGWVEI